MKQCRDFVGTYFIYEPISNRRVTTTKSFITWLKWKHTQEIRMFSNSGWCILRIQGPVCYCWVLISFNAACWEGVSWGVVLHATSISSAVSLHSIRSSDGADIFSSTDKFLAWNDTHILKICFPGCIYLETEVLKIKDHCSVVRFSSRRVYLFSSQLMFSSFYNLLSTLFLAICSFFSCELFQCWIWTNKYFHDMNLGF